jgi:hypothetical protein
MRDSLLPDPASAAAERERAIALLDAAATVAPIRARASLRDCALLQRRAGSGGGPGSPPPRRDETCPVSTEGGTRCVQLVRKEGRDVSN